VATSIDALAVGISLSLLPHIRICPVVLLIGAITLLLSALGVGLGNLFGSKYKVLARAAGGAILIGMGIKILLEHLFEA
jgi:putative Mn2+ efflux pump MntP